MLILFSSEKALTLLKRSAIIKSSKRARGGKPGQGRKEMTRKFTPDYDQEMFEIMISDWKADNGEQAEKIEVTEIYLDEELGWVAIVVDGNDGMVYTLVDDEHGNIRLS